MHAVLDDLAHIKASARSVTFDNTSRAANLWETARSTCKSYPPRPEVPQVQSPNEHVFYSLPASLVAIESPYLR